MLNDIDTQKVVCAARQMVGTPFRHQGRSGSGCDCAGVVLAAADAINFKYTAAVGYARIPEGSALKNLLDKQLTRIQKKEIHIGCVALFRMGRVPQHLGIIADYKGGPVLSLIHSNGKLGKVVEHVFAAPWIGRLDQLYTFDKKGS